MARVSAARGAGRSGWEGVIVVMVFWGMAACAGLFILTAIFVELWRVRELLERVERRMVAGLEMRQALAGEEGARRGAEMRGGRQVNQERDTEPLAPRTGHGEALPAFWGPTGTLASPPVVALPSSGVTVALRRVCGPSAGDGEPPTKAATEGPRPLPHGRQGATM